MYNLNTWSFFELYLAKKKKYLYIDLKKRRTKGWVVWEVERSHPRYWSVSLRYSVVLSAPFSCWLPLILNPLASPPPCSVTVAPTTLLPNPLLLVKVGCALLAPESSRHPPPATHWLLWVKVGERVTESFRGWRSGPKQERERQQAWRRAKRDPRVVWGGTVGRVTQLAGAGAVT